MAPNLHITCVIEKYPSNCNINSLFEYANTIGATFNVRLYNPYKYSEDRHYIERLPAFHLYRKPIKYKKTFYINSNYVKEVGEIADELSRKEEKRKEDAELWNKRLGFLAKIIGR